MGVRMISDTWQMKRRDLVVWLVLLLAFVAGCGGPRQARETEASPISERGRWVLRETAELPPVFSAAIDAKAGVAVVQTEPEWDKWDLFVWRRGKQPAKVLSGSGRNGGVSVSPDGSQVLLSGRRESSAEARVTWFMLTRRNNEPEEFYGEIADFRGAWDPRGVRWLAHRKELGGRYIGYIIHSRKGEKLLKEIRPRIGLVFYWLPGDGDWAYALTVDGAIHRVSAEDTPVVMRVQLPERLHFFATAAVGDTLFFASKDRITRVDVAARTTSTKRLPKKISRLGEVWTVVILDDDTLALVVGQDETEEAWVVTFEWRDSRAEIVTRVPSYSVYVGGDGQGLCIAWNEMHAVRTKLAWYERELK